MINFSPTLAGVIDTTTLSMLLDTDDDKKNHLQTLFFAQRHINQNVPILSTTINRCKAGAYE